MASILPACRWTRKPSQDFELPLCMYTSRLCAQDTPISSPCLASTQINLNFVRRSMFSFFFFDPLPANSQALPPVTGLSLHSISPSIHSFQWTPCVTTSLYAIVPRRPSSCYHLYVNTPFSAFSKYFFSLVPGLQRPGPAQSENKSTALLKFVKGWVLWDPVPFLDISLYEYSIILSLLIHVQSSYS